MKTVIGDNIRKLRQRHGLTQLELAKRLHVQFQTVSKWETGTTTPDISLLPILADYFQVSIDELFGRNTCANNLSAERTAFLLQAYAQAYGPEAGPWNLSAANKYLEYQFTRFFEAHFIVTETTDICNIGIGAGAWDRYLAYRLKGGRLVSIDRLEQCCKQLEYGLACEGNPNAVEILCADVMDLERNEQFEIVTMVGSTLAESGLGVAMLEKAMDFVKPGGALYYQSLDADEPNAIIRTAFQKQMKLGTFQQENAYGFSCSYYQFIK